MQYMYLVYNFVYITVYNIYIPYIQYESPPGERGRAYWVSASAPPRGADAGQTQHRPGYPAAAAVPPHTPPAPPAGQ